MGLDCTVHEAGISEETGKNFWSSSYDSYNRWRKELALMAGYESDVWVWKNKPEGPFVELIDFSDCEGVLGTATCAKLFEDFKNNQEKAKEYKPETEFYDDYRRWMNACELAMKAGCIHFH